jgi:hypothetical protein
MLHHVSHRMTFVDTSPEKFYDSLLSYEAPSDEFAPLAEPHAMEEPEEVPPEDYKVGIQFEQQPFSIPLDPPGSGERTFDVLPSHSLGAAAPHDRRRSWHCSWSCTDCYPVPAPCCCC